MHHPSAAPDDEGFCSRHGLDLYLRNALVSAPCFLLDLGIVWLLVEALGVLRLAAVAIGFVIANALHYLGARAWVFRGTDRNLFEGYLLFLGNALVGLAVVLLGFGLLSHVFGAHFLLARIAASLIAGTLVFGLNARLNFHAL